MIAAASAYKSHQRFPTVDRVRQAMRGHKRKSPPCERCAVGWRVSAWECDWCGGWHFGHRRYE
jgi:hypothetical protein